MLKRISITGPESTGKSWLAASLADYYDEPWVPEYARFYLENLDRSYDFDDVVAIAKGQYEAEKAAEALARNWLFCDTDFLVLRIWCLVKFGKSHPWIDKMADQHLYTRYLLCDIDLAWQEDPLREHPDFRKELFGMYINELENRNLPYSIVSGSGHERLLNAIDVLKKI